MQQLVHLTNKINVQNIVNSLVILCTMVIEFLHALLPFVEP